MTILLVEDDPQDVRLVRHELQRGKTDRKIEVARDGEEALDYLFCRGTHSARSPHHPPELVVLDLKLPKVDGFDVLRELRSRTETKAIPVVILTSSVEERDLVESYKLGTNSYIQKPVDFDQFRTTIQTLGLYWLEVNQPPPDLAFSPS